MTQPPVDIGELLTKVGEAYRASLPQLTPEEEAAEYQDLMDHQAAEIRDYLDAANAVACCLCHHERPRTRADEPYYYPAHECENARQQWHYQHTWNPKKDAREARRHRRRLRKGRPIRE
ncbi:hypothetical protein [Streptomyces sp. NPDC059080]|uniref:hypothetical protein n=1 Tax=Streptomyces sp. NPDC059080 TaxID=3346718 RepID=UPI0036801007